MKHRINISIALFLSCVLAASSSLVFASSTSLRTATSRKTIRLPKPERLNVTKPVQTVDGQTTTLLSDGRLLVIGGVGAEGTLSSAAINDPLTGERVPLANLSEARAWHSATVLPDGRVFIFGGVGVGGGALKSGEIFDPTTLSFTAYSPVGLSARAFHTATLLMDGKVLFVGGVAENGRAAARIETWNSKTRNANALAARLNVARQKHKATLLADGRVLIESGVDEVGSQVGAIEAFSPETGEFTLAGLVPEPDGGPYLVASLPANDAVDVPVDAIVALRFSKLLAPRTVNAETIVLNSAAGRAYARVVVAESGRMVFVSPLEPLEPNTTYSLTIADEVNALTPATVTFKTADSADRPNDPTDQPEWIPDQNNLRGDWTMKSPKSPWQDLPRLEAEAGVTALSGQTLTLRGQPLANVTLEINGVRTVTDNSGRFLLKSLTAGRHVLKIDGSTASRPGGTYGIFRAGVDIADGKTNSLDYTIWMPRLDMANAVTISSPTATDVSITTPRIPKLELRLPAQTLIRNLAGQPVTQLSITPIPTDRPPFPLPAGIHVPVFFTIQPGGSRVVPPRAQLIYPNFTNSRPGTRIDFWNYDPEGKGWYVYGQGTVNENGSQIIPDPGVVLYEFSGTMVATPTLAPPEAPKPCNPESACGEPVDAATGLFVYHKTDLALADTMPISLRRTYRTRDTQMRPFGIGTSHPYEMFLVGTTWPYTFAEVILPDGGRVRFERVSPGTTFTDAVYEHTSSPSVFYKSRIRWIGLWELKLKDGRVYTFPDSEGQIVPQKAALVGMRDRHGNSLTLTRDSEGNLTRITSENGRWIELTYTGSRITKAKDNIGREVIYGYDASSRLTQVTGANGGITKYTYDTSSRLLTIEDARGIVYLTNEYDTAGRVLKQTMADDTPAVTTDNPTFQFAYTTDTSGKITQSDVTDQRGIVQRMIFNSAGYVETKISALGRPEQQTVTYQRQAGTNQIDTVIDALGRKTRNVYDPAGNLLSETMLADTPQAITWHYTYDPLYNQVTSVKDPLGRIITATLDSLGSITAVTDPLGHRTTATYNSDGQQLTSTDHLGNTTRYTYEGGLLATVTNPLGRKYTLFPDGAGRVLSLTNSQNQITKFEYNALDAPTKIVDPKNGTSEFSYDLNGNMLTLKDGRNNVTTYTYDNMDRMKTRTDALQGSTSVATFEYDKADNLVKVTDRRGKVTTFEYDGLARRTFAGYGFNGSTFESTISYTYDAGDRLRQVVDSAGGTLTFDYNNLNCLTSQTSPHGTVGYTYDSVGRRSTMTVAGQSAVNYTYDDMDRLTQMSQGLNVVSFNYDAINRLLSMTLPNAVVTEYEYDAGSQLTGITYRRGTTFLGDLTYTYDSAGRINKVGGTFARTNLPQAFASATYNALNQVTQKGAQSLTYDANGNLSSDGVNTYTWDARNQLTAISGPGLTASFQYDGLGRRINKTVNGTSTNYLYDEATIVQELSGSTSRANILAGGVDGIFLRSDSGGASSFLSDGLGSTLALTDSNGVAQTQYSYDPFGNSTTTGATSSNTSTFTGREDDGTGLLFYRARYYSPVLQRFISEDPVEFSGGDANLYAYVGNSPTLFNDPSGLSIWRTIIRIFTQERKMTRQVNKMNKKKVLDEVKKGMDEAGDHCVVQVDNEATRDALAKGLSPDGKMRGPEKHPGYPEHVHPNQGPYTGSHIQTHPPGRLRQLASALAPFTMELSGRKGVSNSEFASAVAWDIASAIDPIFLTDLINWLTGLE
ncbi:MAG TPA: RHS repeat-associated core domain-containing protein [Pyrinomonadaceae bacterium]|nr:RHS repeat-associated core domain-containing protein [Pyrinomonadaceae bacterium]